VKGAARLVMLAGAVALGVFLFRANPREVTVVYGLAGSGARAVEVEIARGGEVIRRAELRVGPDGQASHRVRLPDGEYVVRVRGLDGGPPQPVVERTFTVSESGTIVIPMGS
jgi:hypothetical protein